MNIQVIHTRWSSSYLAMFKDPKLERVRLRFLFSLWSRSMCYINTVKVSEQYQRNDTGCSQKLCLYTTHQDFCKSVMSQLHSHAPQHGSDAKTATEPRWRHGGRCMLRPVRADQGQQTGLFRTRALKTQRLNRGAADSIRKILCFL